MGTGRSVQEQVARGQVLVDLDPGHGARTLAGRELLGAGVRAIGARERREVTREGDLVPARRVAEREQGACLLREQGRAGAVVALVGEGPDQARKGVDREQIVEGG